MHFFFFLSFVSINVYGEINQFFLIYMYKKMFLETIFEIRHFNSISYK